MKIINNLPQLLDVQRQLDNIDFLLGTHNISDIGDGTVTGTIHSLNETLSMKSDTSHHHDERYLQKNTLEWSDWKTLNNDECITYRVNALFVELQFMYWVAPQDYTGHQSVFLGWISEAVCDNNRREMVLFRNTGSADICHYACICINYKGEVNLETMGSNIKAGEMLEAHIILPR